jgi:nitroreductase
MELYEAMEKRYSVRTYEDRPVEKDKLERVLNAARIAPSASNKQDWKFVVVQDAGLRAQLAEKAGQNLCVKAPVVIAAVSLKPERFMRCGIKAGTVDCAIAIDHMTLAAVAEGLGTCWIGSFEQDGCREVLGVPESAKIVELMVLGYPADSARPKDRKALDEVVCHERYS